MIKIVYPPYQPSLKTQHGKEYIFDPFRKKWLVLTPEEWVRQHFLQYLVQVLRYPASLTAIEKQVQVGELKKRFDIVVYDSLSNPFMVVECKEMSVPLTEAVMQQALRYNSHLQAKLMVITNGSYCMAFERVSNAFRLLASLPEHNP